MVSDCFFAVCSLVEDSPRGVSDCRDPSLGLEELLNQRVQDLRGQEESQVNSFTHLLTVVFLFFSPVLCPSVSHSLSYQIF